jgi:hypothetical protein
LGRPALAVVTDPYSVDLEVPQYNDPNHGAVDPIYTPLAADSNDYVRVTIKGPATISYAYNGRCPDPAYSPAENNVMVESPNGIVRGNENALFVYGILGGVRRESGWEKNAAGDWVTVYHANHPGGVGLGRAGLTADCDQDTPIGIYALTGATQHATLNTVGASFARPRYDVTQGASVSLTATLLHIDASDVTIVGWSFLPDATPGGSEQFTDCTENLLSCAFTPLQDGMIYANIKIVGGWVRAEAHVSVIRCPIAEPKDALLNNSQVRAILRSALDASGANDPTKPLSARREQGGLIIYNPTTGDYASVASSLPFNTPCSTGMSSPLVIPAGYIVVAYYHTHPFQTAGPWGRADILPVGCGDQAGRQYAGRPSGAPNDPDTDWPQAVAQHRQGIYIDKHYVGVYDGREPTASNPANWLALNRRYDWNTSACSW